MKKTPTSSLIRFLCMVFAASLMISLFAGCKGKEGNVSSENQSSAMNISGADPTEVIEMYEKDPNIPETFDLDGFEMVIATDTVAKGFIAPQKGSSNDGDIVLSALSEVEKAYNCKVSFIEEDDWTGTVLPELLTGQEYANVIMPCLHQCGHFVSARLCANYLENDIRQYIHQEEPWWNDTMTYASNVYGEVYAGAPCILSPADYTFVIFFNKEIAGEIGVDEDELYDLYYNKTWTWDAFRKYARLANKDLDNDGQMTQSDRWGMATTPYDTIQGFLSSANCSSIITENGMNPTYNYSTSFAVSTLTTLNEIFTTDGYNCPSCSDPLTMFTEGHSLFMSYQMKFCTKDIAREMDDDYGVLPIPLGPSENGGWQTDYMSRVDHNIRIALIPVTVTDKASTALVFEAMAFRYWKIINKKTEAYGATYLSDDNAAHIVNEVYNYSTYEISQFLSSVNNNAWWTTVEVCIGSTSVVDGYDVAGNFASVSEAAQLIIDDYFGEE